MKSLPLYRQLTPLPQITGLQKPAVHSLQQGLSLVELEEVPTAVKLVFMNSLWSGGLLGGGRHKAGNSTSFHDAKQLSLKNTQLSGVQSLGKFPTYLYQDLKGRKSSRRKSSRWRKCYTLKGSQMVPDKSNHSKWLSSKHCADLEQMFSKRIRYIEGTRTRIHGMPGSCSGASDQMC